MEPGIMDFGVKERAFFADLSTVAPPSSFSGSKAETETDEEVMSNTVTDHPYVKDEYDLAKEMVSEMNDEFVMLGWHNYCKDEEHDYTTLVSANGGRVHGLNTNPNLSFQSQVDVSPDFVFKNQHSQGSKKRGESGENEVEGAIDCERMHEKTYIVLVQTDGLGLGAWVQPGRGSLPYTWEVRSFVIACFEQCPLPLLSSAFPSYHFLPLTSPLSFLFYAGYSPRLRDPAGTPPNVL